MSNYKGLLDMKKIKFLKKAVITFAVVFINFCCYGQLEVVTNIPSGHPIGGYQGGLFGSGGDETYKDVPFPRNLTAIGGDNEVFLKWDEPLPLGEVRYDDNSAENWYWLNNPTTSNDMFYVKFNAPVSGSLTNIAVLNGAVPSANWDNILICPDDGFGKPDLGSSWETFNNIAVSTSPEYAGEWNILTLTVPHVVMYSEVFYIVTQWPTGSTTGPFVAADGDSDSGKNAYSLDGGSTWVAWPQNFFMRAYMESDNNKSVTLISGSNTVAAYVPVITISNGKLFDMKPLTIAQSIKAPEIISPNSMGSKGFNQYKVYKATTLGGPYSFVDNATSNAFTDNTATNSTEYFYVVTADYTDGESGNSNEATAYPQGAEGIPYSNNFDADNGNFHGTIDWEWGVPSYGGGPASANSIPNAWGTNLSGDYNNLASSWLVMPFDMGEQVTYELSFAYWHALETGLDYGYLAIDQNYDGIYKIINSFDGLSGGWQTQSVVIHDSLTTAYARLAFVVLSDGSNTLAGMYIDDVEIKRYIDLDITAFLEGPFNGANMNVDLNSAGLLPLNQPFNVSPWNYTGTESVGAIPDPSILDWVLVELRDALDATSATSGTIISRQAGFINNAGVLVELDGSSLLRFDDFPTIVQNVFVVILHRNHLGIMTSLPVVLAVDKYSWNFTSGLGQAYNSGQKLIGTGIWGMYGGDENADGLVNSTDIGAWVSQAGTKGYKSGDFDLDSQVNNVDKNDVWFTNFSMESQVPD